jgi:hypothetical protein
LLRGEKEKRKKKCTCRQDVSFPGRLLTFFSGAYAFPLAIPEYKDKMYRAIILHIVSHKCENWFLTLKEEHMLVVLKDRVLRKICGPKKEKVRGKWRRLHSEELHDLYLY